MGMHEPTTEPAKRLLKWRQTEKLTQADLAKRLGAKASTVSAWMCGRTPSLRDALAVRDLTGIDVEEWVPEFRRPQKRKSA